MGRRPYYLASMLAWAGSDKPAAQDSPAQPGHHDRQAQLMRCA